MFPSRFLSYLVLLRVGFAMPRPLLRGRCALTAPFHPYLGLAPGAVSSLWHFPSSALEGALPDVIRHTALGRSDFPPSLRAASDFPAFAARRRPSGPSSTPSIIGWEGAAGRCSSGGAASTERSCIRASPERRTRGARRRRPG